MGFDMMNFWLRCGVAACLCSPCALLAQGHSPEDALKRMTVADGFQVKLVAAEPLVRQPVTMTFDDRGRMWVIQYLQYPTPAGLKAVKVDQFLRTVYDRVPEPPPHGPKGIDRITILFDPDENGRFRKSKDFVTGLNLASGMALGHGGVFVAQSPYLLFYPDRDGDDVPDGDPEVLLKGFGMQDAHAFPNSLQWGPDGWLYGAQGSTVTANIRGIEFQQGIWRYHPLTKAFELFCEGGGNTWGVDFDRHGNVIAGTNFGGRASLHQVQGGYYVKGFAKHGPLHNPHTYGYFEHMPYPNFKGGHVTCGGIVYQGGLFPEKFHNQYIAANPLSNAIHWHKIDRDGSSFKSEHGGELVTTSDTWFRPIDCLTGPDGAVYFADWYDMRINHVDPVDNWDRTNGRIYRLEPKESRVRGQGSELQGPLSKRSSKELVELLGHPNDWYRREARRLLAERRDASVIPALREQLQRRSWLALQALWALYVSGGFDESVALELLKHPNDDVRTWTIRLLGDTRKVTTSVQARLVETAKNDASLTVRSQLACTAKRLPASASLPIIRELLRHDADVKDPHIPLLLWWAIEDKAISDTEAVLGLLDSAEAWQRPLISQELLERLGRRFMAEGTDAGYAVCARLLTAAPGMAETNRLLSGMEKALEGRKLDRVPAALEKHLAGLLSKQPDSAALVRFALRLGSEPAYARVVQLVGDPKYAERDRLGLIEILGQVGKPDCVPALLKAIEPGERDPVRRAALTALLAFQEPRIGERVLALYPRMSADLKNRSQTLLCSRPESARAFVKAVDAGQVPAKEVPLDQVRRLATHKDDEMQKLIQKHWGRVGPAPPGEKTARIRAIGVALSRGIGDAARGKPLFVKHCAVCHQLFGEGNKIGPDLTSVDRLNRDFMVTSTVDPSAIIRPEYTAFTVAMKDGRTLTGLIVEASPQAVTLVDAKNERTILGRDRIEALEASPVSLMPEKVLDELNDQQLRDLFAYIRGGSPKPRRRRWPVARG